MTPEQKQDFRDRLMKALVDEGGAASQFNAALKPFVMEASACATADDLPDYTILIGEALSNALGNLVAAYSMLATMGNAGNHVIADLTCRAIHRTALDALESIASGQAANFKVSRFVKGKEVPFDFRNHLSHGSGRVEGDAA